MKPVPRGALPIACALAAVVAVWAVLGVPLAAVVAIILILYGVWRIDNHTGSCMMLSVLILIVVLVMILLLVLLAVLPHS